MADDTQGRAETERLLLIPWHDDYVGEFARVVQDPDAMRFISAGRPLTLEEITSIPGRSRAMWDEYGYGPWAAVVMEKCGLVYQGEIAFRTARVAWYAIDRPALVTLRQ